MEGGERVPFQVTEAGALYAEIREMPVVALLDNFRSLYNVGAFFRSADAVSIQRLALCGVTGTPPHPGIAKTALGAERTVRWQHFDYAAQAIAVMRAHGYEIAAIETSTRSVDLFDWTPAFPVCVLFGNEVDGLDGELLDVADVHVRVPMLGLKHSLNVATAGGIVLYELLRKYRRLMEAAGR